VVGFGGRVVDSAAGTEVGGNGGGEPEQHV